MTKLEARRPWYGCNHSRYCCDYQINSSSKIQLIRKCKFSRQPNHTELWTEGWGDPRFIVYFVEYQPNTHNAERINLPASLPPCISAGANNKAATFDWMKKTAQYVNLPHDICLTWHQSNIKRSQHAGQLSVTVCHGVSWCVIVCHIGGYAGRQSGKYHQLMIKADHRISTNFCHLLGIWIFMKSWIKTFCLSHEMLKEFKILQEIENQGSG